MIYAGTNSFWDRGIVNQNFAERMVWKLSLLCVLIKTYISNLIDTMRFLNNLHQVRSKSNDWKI